MNAHQQIRRRTNGTIDIDFYRSQALTERAAMRFRVGRRLLRGALIAGAMTLGPARFETRTTWRRRFAAGLIVGAAAVGGLFAINEASAQQRMPEAAQPRQSARAEVAATEVSRTPYQAYLAADCIAGSNFCKFISEAVPPRRRLEIHRVACQGWHSSDTPPNFVVFAELRTDADVFIGRIDFLETTYTRVSTNTVWQISEQVLMFIPARHRLRISLNSASTGVGSYGCAISGYLVTLSPSS